MNEQDADYIEYLILKYGLEIASYELIRNGYTIKEIKEIHQEMLDAGWEG
jgi:hypothetical protein